MGVQVRETQGQHIMAGTRHALSTQSSRKNKNVRGKAKSSTKNKDIRTTPLSSAITDLEALESKGMNRMSDKHTDEIYQDMLEFALHMENKADLVQALDKVLTGRIGIKFLEKNDRLFQLHRYFSLFHDIVNAKDNAKALEQLLPDFVDVLGIFSDDDTDEVTKIRSILHAELKLQICLAFLKEIVDFEMPSEKEMKLVQEKVNHYLPLMELTVPQLISANAHVIHLTKYASDLHQIFAQQDQFFATQMNHESGTDSDEQDKKTIDVSAYETLKRDHEWSKFVKLLKMFIGFRKSNTFGADKCHLYKLYSSNDSASREESEYSSENDQEQVRNGKRDVAMSDASDNDDSDDGSSQATQEDGYQPMDAEDDVSSAKKSSDGSSSAASSDKKEGSSAPASASKSHKSSKKSSRGGNDDDEDKKGKGKKSAHEEEDEDSSSSSEDDEELRKCMETAEKLNRQIETMKAKKRKRKAKRRAAAAANSSADEDDEKVKKKRKKKKYVSEGVGNSEPVDKGSPKSSDKRRKVPVAWTDAEVAALKAGLKEYGIGDWRNILKARKKEFHELRTVVALKDKFRNMLRSDPHLADRYKKKERKK